MMLRLIARNAAEVHRNIEKADKARGNAARVALRVEAQRLRLQLKKEIRAGAPGGHALSPLSILARRTRDGRKPLARLAIPVRYWESAEHSMPGIKGFSVGFNGGTVVGMSGEARTKNQISKSWIRIATFQQEGGQVELTKERRLAIIRMGGKLKKQGWEGEAKYYFLRKPVRPHRVPARRIIDPFWDAHRPEAARNIVSNYERKLRGERI
jgi:hypothetical protein